MGFRRVNGRDLLPSSRTTPDALLRAFSRAVHHAPPLTAAAHAGLIPPPARRYRRARQPPSLVQHRSQRTRHQSPSPPPTFVFTKQSPVTRLFSSDLSERGYPGPVSEQAGLSIDEPGLQLCGLLKPTEPPILVARPPHYVGINALQETMQARPVDRAIVVHAAAYDRVDPLGKLIQAAPDALMDPPATDLLTFRFESVRADRRRERREQLPVPVLRAARTELIPQERERRMLIRAPPVGVPAVHYPGLPGMQPQPQALQSLRESIPHFARLILRRAMEHRIVCITLELHRRELSSQPRIHGVMQKQVGQDGRHL